MEAPDFCLKGIDFEGKEREICLKDLRGKWVVLYFYPKDNTSGCTIEAKEFTELLPEFEKLGAVVIGVSKDSIESHRKFREKHGLRVTLLSDPETKVIRAYGAWGKKFRGEGTIRSTFIIDPQGRIVWEKRNVRARGHAAKVLETLKELQKAF
ncbi:MAG: peroxiredoxin [Candidatus Diapherotrites archaeon]|nr:peroxiredoxin [Candidatus Diapherotrites archaeon]